MSSSPPNECHLQPFILSWLSSRKPRTDKYSPICTATSVNALHRRLLRKPCLSSWRFPHTSSDACHSPFGPRNPAFPPILSPSTLFPHPCPPLTSQLATPHILSSRPRPGVSRPRQCAHHARRVMSFLLSPARDRNECWSVTYLSLCAYAPSESALQSLRAPS